MKAETVRALARLEIVLERIMILPEWHISDSDGAAYIAFSDKNDVQRVISVLKKLPEAEKCLARGGMVRDANGRWCSHGDEVRFRRGRNADYKQGDDWQHGKLYYSVEDGTWYIEDGDGDWFRLGPGWEEVCRWVYEGDKNDCV